MGVAKHLQSVSTGSSSRRLLIVIRSGGMAILTKLIRPSTCDGEYDLVDGG